MMQLICPECHVFVSGFVGCDAWRLLAFRGVIFSRKNWDWELILIDSPSFHSRNADEEQFKAHDLTVSLDVLQY